MLDDKRIMEAQANVRSYLSEGLLRSIKIKDPIVMRVLVNNSKESLKVAEILFENDLLHIHPCINAGVSFEQSMSEASL